MPHCLNCNSPLTGAFCSKCGQKANTHRFTMAHVLHEIPHSVFHLDAGIFRNIRSIAYPRRAVQDYLAGKRKAYFNPALFYFITLGVLLFLAQKFDLYATINVAPESWNVEGYDGGRWINSFVKFLFFGCAFVFAGVNYFLFRKETKYTYPEQVIACFFLLGYVNIIGLFALLTPFADPVPFNWPTAIGLFLFTYLIYFRGKLWLTAIKALISVGLYVTLFLIIVTLIGYIGYLFLKITQ